MCRRRKTYSCFAQRQSGFKYERTNNKRKRGVIQTHDELLVSKLVTRIPVVVFCRLIIVYTKTLCGQFIHSQTVNFWVFRGIYCPLGLSLLTFHNLDATRGVQWRNDLQQFVPISTTTTTNTFPSDSPETPCRNGTHLHQCDHELHLHRDQHSFEMLTCGSQIWYRQPRLLICIACRIGVSDSVRNKKIPILLLHSPKSEGLS